MADIMTEHAIIPEADNAETDDVRSSLLKYGIDIRANLRLSAQKIHEKIALVDAGAHALEDQACLEKWIDKLTTADVPADEIEYMESRIRKEFDVFAQNHKQCFELDLLILDEKLEQFDNMIEWYESRSIDDDEFKGLIDYMELEIRNMVLMADNIPKSFFPEYIRSCHNLTLTYLPNQLVKKYLEPMVKSLRLTSYMDEMTFEDVKKIKIEESDSESDASNKRYLYIMHIMCGYIMEMMKCDCNRIPIRHYHCDCLNSDFAKSPDIIKNLIQFIKKFPADGIVESSTHAAHCKDKIISIEKSVEYFRICCIKYSEYIVARLDDTAPINQDILEAALECLAKS